MKNFYQIKHKLNLWSAHKNRYMMCLNLDESVRVRSLLIILQSSQKSIQGRREKCLRASETVITHRRTKRTVKFFRIRLRECRSLCVSKVKRERCEKNPTFLSRHRGRKPFVNLV